MTGTIINKMHFRRNSLLAIKHILYYDLPNKTPVTAEITDTTLYRHLELCYTSCDELQLPCSVFTYFPWLQHVKSCASLIISHSCCFCLDYLLWLRDTPSSVILTSITWDSCLFLNGRAVIFTFEPTLYFLPVYPQHY